MSVELPTLPRAYFFWDYDLSEDDIRHIFSRLQFRWPSDRDLWEYALNRWERAARRWRRSTSIIASASISTCSQ